MEIAELNAEDLVGIDLGVLPRDLPDCDQYSGLPHPPNRSAYEASLPRMPRILRDFAAKIFLSKE